MVLIHRLDAPNFAVECSACLFCTADGVDHFSIKLGYSVFSASDRFVECDYRTYCEAHSGGYSNNRECCHCCAEDPDARAGALCRCGQSADDFNDFSDSSVDFAPCRDQVSCRRNHRTSRGRQGSHLDDLVFLRFVQLGEPVDDVLDFLDRFADIRNQLLAKGNSQFFNL